MEKFFNNIFLSIGINDILDILIVAFIFYKILQFIQESRAQQLIKGLLVLIVAFFLSDIFNLYALNWLLRGTMTVGAIALVVVFQPELRRALEYVGRSKIVKAPFGQMDKEKAKSVTDEFVKALSGCSNTKTGALIILERDTSLTEIVESGTVVNADISAQLLMNIFYEGAPLHDGAVIIRGDRIHAASCVLPLTNDRDLNKSLGTRHRAGIGITEHSDAIAFIVSEETGIISMAIDGKLTRFLDAKKIEKTLLNLYLSEDSNEKVMFFGRFFDRKGKTKNDGK